MAELISKEPTETEELKKQVIELSAELEQKEAELKATQEKTVKRPSLGYVRARFR